MESAQTEPVVRLAAQDATGALATLILAFGADPMTRWSWTQAEAYLESFPYFVRAFAGPAFENRRVYATSDLRAVAVWLAPGEEPDKSQFGELMTRIDPNLSETMGDMFGQMERAHPSEPHWYLPLVGVDPTSQGRGLGGRVLQPVLEECDRTRALAYLESSNPRNIPLYQRLGFHVTGELQAGNSPTLTSMVRRPA